MYVCVCVCMCVCVCGVCGVCGGGGGLDRFLGINSIHIFVLVHVTFQV